MFTAGTALGAVLTLALVALVGIRAGKKVKSAGDFTAGSGMGIPIMESFMTSFELTSLPGKGTTVHMRRKLQRRQ